MDLLSLKEKNVRRKKICSKTVEKGEMSNFNLFFHNSIYAICIYKSLIAILQLSSAAALNLGQSQNDALGNGLREFLVSKQKATSGRGDSVSFISSTAHRPIGLCHGPVSVRRLSVIFYIKHLL